MSSDPSRAPRQSRTGPMIGWALFGIVSFSLLAIAALTSLPSWVRFGAALAWACSMLLGLRRLRQTLRQLRHGE